MPKKLIDPAWLVLGCLVLLIWQLSVPAHAQAQTQSALDSKGTIDRGPAAPTASAQSDLASKKVLILHSFAYAQPVYKIIDNALIRDGDAKVVLQIGTEEWPFPIPIVKRGEEWSFDTRKGREELINRRIGRNELNTIQTCLAYVDAQREKVRRTALMITLSEET